MRVIRWGELFGALPIFFCALLLISPGGSHARPLDDVIASGVLKIAVYEKFRPFSYKENGELKGIDIAIGRALAKDLGVKPEFMVFAADENIDDDLRNAIWKGRLIGGRTSSGLGTKDVADVMLHVPYDTDTKVRNNLVVFFGQYFTEGVSVLVDPVRVPNTTTLAPFVYEKIGVEIDTLADLYLSSAVGGRLLNKLTHFASFDAAVDGFKKGDVAALMGTMSQIDWAQFYAGNGSKVVQPAMPGLQIREWHVGLAVKEDSRDLAYQLGDTITKMRGNGALKGIFAGFGVRYNAKFLD